MAALLQLKWYSFLPTLSLKYVFKEAYEVRAVLSLTLLFGAVLSGGHARFQNVDPILGIQQKVRFRLLFVNIL